MENQTNWQEHYFKILEKAIATTKISDLIKQRDKRRQERDNLVKKIQKIDNEIIGLSSSSEQLLDQVAIGKGKEAEFERSVSELNRVSALKKVKAKMIFMGPQLDETLKKAEGDLFHAVHSEIKKIQISEQVEFDEVLKDVFERMQGWKSGLSKIPETVRIKYENASIFFMSSNSHLNISKFLKDLKI